MSQAVLTVSLLLLSVVVHLRCAGDKWGLLLYRIILVHAFLVTATNTWWHTGDTWALSGPVTDTSMVFAALSLLCGQLLDVNVALFPVNVLSRKECFCVHMAMAGGVVLFCGFLGFFGRASLLRSMSMFLVVVVGVILTNSDRDGRRHAFFLLDSVVIFFLVFAGVTQRDGFRLWDAIIWMYATLKEELDAKAETLGASEEE